MSPMNLSQAIRLGSMLKPQAFETVYDAKTGGTCAFGAACDALGVLSVTGEGADYAFGRVWEMSAWLNSSGYSHCPDCGYSLLPLNAITHLNDEHRWTRERIADWVEQQEVAREQTTEAPVCVTTTR